METQLRINLVDINDYFSMREKNQSSNVKWEYVKHLNTHLGYTLWSLFSKCKNYDERYEPSKIHIKEVKKILNLR